MSHTSHLFRPWRPLLGAALLALLVACGGSQTTDTRTSPQEATQRAALNSAELQRAQEAAASASVPVTKAAQSTARLAVWRFYNRLTSAHFYTTSTTERDSVLANLPQMSLDGTAFYVGTATTSGLSPVYRFYNLQTGVHFYTISQDERDTIIARLPQFHYEGVAYHASKITGSGLRPLYRFYLARAGVHFYTIHPEEVAALPQYQAEGVAYYVYDGEAGIASLSYTPDQSTDFANPERGFYRSNGGCDYTGAELALYRQNEHLSLVFCTVDLGPHVASDLDQADLDLLASRLATLRQSGFKAILRFAYAWDMAISPRDATHAQVLRHIAQLAPLLGANADVIATVQAGFVGTWGEWYYSDHYGNEGVISETQWADRRAVVNALLQALPAQRGVQLRTPAFKQRFYGSTPLDSATAFGGSDASRVGHHNDCFLASATDYGTYTDIGADKSYLAQEGLYLPVGGETCAVSAYSGWSNALADMSALHYTFLNASYHPGVLSAWGTNIEQASRRLGYRFSLVAARLPVQATVGGQLTLGIDLFNSGFAAPFNPRPVVLVLRHTGTGVSHRLTLNTDPRRWTPGATTTISQTLSLAGIPSGSYTLWLHLPDPMPTLAALPAYAIRLANTPDPWDAGSGLNALNHTLVIQ